MIRGEGRGGGVGKNNIMEKEEGGKWNTEESLLAKELEK